MFVVITAAAFSPSARPLGPLLHHAHVAVRGTPVVAVSNYVQAANLFNNMRTPAALVAGACLPLGFGLPLPSASDSTPVRAAKRSVVLLAFLSFTSELLAVTFATNGISRLYMPAMFDAEMLAASTVHEVLTHSHLIGFWLGVYVHFVFGIVGLVAISGLRACLVVGPEMALPIGLLTGAILLRLKSAVNRSVMCASFGSGSFAGLVARYCLITVKASWHMRRPCELASIGLVVAAMVLLLMRLPRAGAWSPGFLGSPEPPAVG